MLGEFLIWSIRKFRRAAYGQRLDQFPPYDPFFSRFHCRLPSQGTVPVRQPVNHVSNLRSPAEILLME